MSARTYDPADWPYGVRCEGCKGLFDTPGEPMVAVALGKTDRGTDIETPAHPGCEHLIDRDGALAEWVAVDRDLKAVDEEWTA